jgi:hypothetical protein
LQATAWSVKRLMVANSPSDRWASVRIVG